MPRFKICISYFVSWPAGMQAISESKMIAIHISKHGGHRSGLYCMAGNVAEWTSSVYYEGAYNFSHDMNPDIRYNAKDSDPPRMKRKVIRGGSWKDVGYFLQTSTRTYEYQDTAKSYIGFRCVIDLPPTLARR